MTSAVQADRRRAPRRPPDPREPAARLRLRTGRELTVIDIASAGALVETDGRLLPGTCVDVHVPTVDGRRLIRSRIVRANVSRVSAYEIAYRAGVAFSEPVELAPLSTANHGQTTGAASSAPGTPEQP